MDVEAVQNTQAKMRSGKESIIGELNSLSGLVNQTIGTNWIGNSASEFQQSYDHLRSSLTQQLDALDQLTQALQSEIGQWQEMSARMG
jgi:uncharacterized protein YukE